MHHNFRNHNLRRERRETGSAGWGPVQSKQFPCGYFTLLRGGINPIWKLSENSWNMFCLVVPLWHQCRASRSRSIIQYLWEILKSLISQTIRSIFVNFQFFPPSSIDEHFSSQTWKVKVGIRWMLERYNQFRSILLFLCWSFRSSWIISDKYTFLSCILPSSSYIFAL